MNRLENNKLASINNEIKTFHSIFPAGGVKNNASRRLAQWFLFHLQLSAGAIKRKQIGESRAAIITAREAIYCPFCHVLCSA